MVSGRISRTICSLLAASMLVVCGGVKTAKAQNGRDILGGLLNELVRSQIERRDRKRNEQSRRLNPFPGTNLSPNPRTVPRPAPKPKLVMTPKMKQARGYFDSFATECDRLSTQLYQQRTVPGVKTHLDEVLRLKARSALLRERYSQPHTQVEVIADIQDLDRDWRTASYHLNQLQLNNSCRQSITKLDGFNKQCCQLYNVSPQVDQRNLIRLANSLAEELHHLERDVRTELRGNPNAQQFVFTLRRLSQRANLLADSVSDGDSYDVIVGEFQQLIQEWNPVARAVDGFNDRHIDRTAQDVHDLVRAMHEQLWLPVGIDREHLKHLGTVTRSHLKEMMDMLPLSLLVDLQDGPQVLTAGKAIRDATQDICGCMDRNESVAELTNNWQVLDKCWREFDHYTSTVDAPRLRTLRTEIDSHIGAMRQGLGVQLVFDRREVIRSAAALDGLAEQARYHLQQWQRRPNSNIDPNLVRSANTLINDCHNFHQGCAGRTTQVDLARDCDKIVRSWTQLRPALAQCNTVDQVALRRISDDATAQLIHLQSILAD